MTSSQQPSTRAGSTKRIVLGILAFVVITPILITLLSKQMRADERPRLLSDQPLKIGLPGPPHIPTAEPPGGRAPLSHSIQYREEEVMQEKYITDPQTGKLRKVPEVIRRYVPVHSVFQQLSNNQQKSHDIATRLRQLRDGDEETKEALLKELKSHLAAEFQERHDRQAKEIEAAQARIEALKEMHQKRSDLKDDIIGRRLNELIGGPDVLKWDAELGAARTTPDVRPNMMTRLAPVPTGYDAPGTRESVPVHRGADPRIPGPGPYGSPIGRATTISPQPDRWQATSKTRVDIVNSQSSDVFAIARRLLTSRLVLKSATAEFHRMRKLAKRRAISQSELVKQNLQVQTAEADVAFAEAELEAVQQRLQRESEFAQSQLERAAEIVSNAKAQYKAGVQTTDSMLKAESAYAIAKQLTNAAGASLQEMKKALELIESASPADDDEGVGSEVADEIDADDKSRDDDQQIEIREAIKD